VQPGAADAVCGGEQGMIAFFIAYAIVGLITWAGMIVQFSVGGHVWRSRDIYGLPVTMIGVAALWPAGFAFWQYKQWRKGRNS
jgi:hypothetical protein